MAFYNEMWDAFGVIFRAPFKDLSALWMLIPLLIIWFILEIYFGTHKKEQLGWNTALGNGISMFWITVALMRNLFQNNFEAFTFLKFSGVFILFIYAIFISYISFQHKFSAKVTYAISAPTPVYFISGVIVLWAYGALEIGLWIFVDLMILFLIVLGVVELLRKFLPEAADDAGESGSAFGGSEKSDMGDDLGDMKL